MSLVKPSTKMIRPRRTSSSKKSETLSGFFLETKYTTNCSVRNKLAFQHIGMSTHDEAVVPCSKGRTLIYGVVFSVVKVL